MAPRELQTILEKDDAGAFHLYACRGTGKGCERNKYRKSLKHCADCVGPLDESMTLGEVEDLLKRGDA